jgi:autophagy-related protein 5
MGTPLSGEHARYRRGRHAVKFSLGACRHWPIGLLYDNHMIAATIRPSSTTDPVPLRLVLHLAQPPTDKLLLVPNADSCKQAFMGQLKEADFIRWGSTKRMTSLRKAEQDGIWEGIKERTYGRRIVLGNL